MPAKRHIADPTIVRCPEVLASSSGDSNVALLEGACLLGRSASGEVTALSSMAKAFASSAVASACSASTLSGAVKAAGAALWLVREPLGVNAGCSGLTEALVSCSGERRGYCRLPWQTL